MKKFGILIAAMFLMTGCGKEIPGDIIQPAQMEEVLYDYHLAMGMSTSLKNTDKEAYRKFVFGKHRITEELFDSSMVWYTREAQELTMIYANLEKRFRLQHNQAEMVLKSRGEQKMQFTAEGDSVNIWNQDDLFWMTEAPLMNKMTFELKADTNFYPKDMFVWDVDFHFFREGRATMGLNVVFENDSVIGETRQITASGRQSIRLIPDSAYQIKALNGFIYVPEDSVTSPSMLVHNISLMRYHQEGADTLSTPHQLPPLVEDKPDKKRLKKMQSQ